MLRNPRPATEPTAAQIEQEVTTRIGAGRVAELQEEGFPVYMIYAFLRTAEETNSVVLSRVPGGRGLDLIEKGYDLKGYHIKAKSCNWGPMAGFICQLPLFNKSGYSKLVYNTMQLADYLGGIDYFAPVKDLDQDDREQMITEMRTYTETSGKWSGENTLPAAEPWVDIVREFPHESQNDLCAQVGRLPGVLFVVPVKETGMLYGMATNGDITDDKKIRKGSVITEFIMVSKQSRMNNFKLYYGRTRFARPGESGFPHACNKAQDLIDEVTSKLSEKEKASLSGRVERICSFSEDVLEGQALVEQAGGGQESISNIRNAMSPFQGIKELFDFNNWHDLSFYRIRGVMNPFPPYTKPDELYKNAVSGDYDLFAMWPHVDGNPDELIRQSERVVGPYLRQGGKVFTSWTSNKCGIEFIPSFKELATDGGVKTKTVKEDPEFGNMNNFGHLVSGTLNSFATGLFRRFRNADFSGNKSFHSDEGGRPGIIAIEFPVAVFLPKKQDSCALAAPMPGKETHIGKPGGDGRVAEQTQGGLIKNEEELLAFMVEVMDADYRVLLHSGWMLHLLYLLTAEDGANRDQTLRDLMVKYPPKTDKLRADLVAEMKAIEGALRDGALADRFYTEYVANFIRIFQRTESDRPDAEPFFKSIFHEEIWRSALTQSDAQERKNKLDELLLQNRIVLA